MPINPREDEDRDDFISRCMSEEKDAIPDQDQRLAACNDMWERDKAEADASEASAKVAEFLGLHQQAGTGYQFKAVERRAEILIYEEIGDDMFGGVSAKQVATDLRAAKNIDRITVRVNSPGGNIFDGVAIYNTLMAHPATVEVFIDGLAASAASIIAMAGDPIHMADNAVLMIHDPWFMAIGNAGELRAIADSLDKVADGMALTYARRSGTELNQVREWMRAETWFTAEEARAAGFADTIEEPRRMAAACFDIQAWRKRFRHPPDDVFARLEEESRPGTPVSSFEDNFRRMAMRRARLGQE